MAVTPWSGDPAFWQALSLPERLHMLRVHFCTGPCGQSSSVLAARTALGDALTQAIEQLQEKPKEAANV